MPIVALFDIDGTLVLTGGAGRRALSLAFDDLFGVPDALVDVPLAGRTDAWLLAQALTSHQRAPDESTLARFRDRYLVHLAAELQKPARGKQVMPGVRPLLDVLAARDDVYLALLTGNYRQGARLKLEHFDLWRYFRAGAFGDEAHDRNQLVGEALASVRQAGGPDVSPSEAVVVGDTPLDVACAAAAGARSIAVATGGFDVEVLRRSGADAVFPDLSDLEAVLRALARTSPPL